MANERKSFLVYFDTQSQVEMLTDEEAGLLFKSLFRYGMTGEVLDTDNRTLAFAFSMFQSSLDRNNEKYDRIVEKRREAGKRHKGNQYTRNGTNGTSVPTMEQNGTNGTDRDRDSVRVRDSVSDRDRDRDRENNNSVVLNNILSIAKSCEDRKLQRRKDNFMSSLEPFRQTYGDAMIDDFCDYWTEPNKSGTKMRYEMERTWDLSRRIKRWASNRINQHNNNDGNNQGHNDNNESPRERSIRENEEALRRERERFGISEEVWQSTEVDDLF